MTGSFDWDALRVFATAAEAGSFSAAARRLAISQPTASRQIQSLEEQLGTQLFQRTSRGLIPTEAALALVEHAKAMTLAANRLALAAAGQVESVAGVVRISASEIVATYRLPAILVALREQEPEIEIELLASNATDNLLQREADIAVRMYRPTQVDVVSRHVGDVEIGIYVADRYRNRRGCPQTPEALLDHDVVGYDRDDAMVRGFEAFGIEVGRDFFPLRTDDQVVAWQMVIEGFGIGFMQVAVGDAEPRVRRILRDVELPRLPIWLASHSELKTNRRIRRVYDWLADALCATST